ncbi:sensor histidine kinase [Sporosarcina aquimarina]|uniref:histidine kinase n=1 Tax=Sporosarcina aquimarina TaxID=114975 RepID=A0ABU4G0Y2_9BACL|nr:ATP-binding protein [Sporosarcina aquimarina]MDW0110050.1 ATP-binding protein [Sporosarcina aquimarina]
MAKELEKFEENPRLYTIDQRIYKVSESFLHLTGYEKRDLIGKSFKEVNCLLKSEFQAPLQDNKEIRIIYIFTIGNVPIKVKVRVDILGNEGHYVVHYEEKESPALDFLLTNFIEDGTNTSGSTAIYSYPECLLLSYDTKYIATLRSMEISSDNLLGKQPSFSEDIQSLMEQGTSVHEFGVKSKGAKGVSFWDINVKMIVEDGTSCYLLTSFYDVTAKTKVKTLSWNQSKELHQLLNNMSDVVIVLDKNGKYTYINEVGKQVLAPYIPRDIQDIDAVTSHQAYNSFALSNTDGRKLAFEEIPEQKVLRGETLSKFKIIGTSDLPTAYYECDGVPIYNEQGTIDGGILVYRNIEPAYKMEEFTALQESVDKISMYYASFSHKDYKINYLNQFAFKNFKEEWPVIKTEADIIGKNFFNYYRAGDLEQLIQHIDEAIETQSSYLHKLEFTKDGITYHTKTMFQPILNQNNEVEKIIALGVDISDEEMANKSMAKLLKAQEELFINTSHELKTPLTVIFSGAQLLNLYLEQDSLEDHKEDILNINKRTFRNCYRLTRLVNNILDISKIESGMYELNLSNFNIVGIIDDIVESVSEYTKSKGVKIIFDPDMEELFMAVDVSKFDRILLNLISNAIKFSIPGETILISLAEKDKDTVSISVRDEGIGIDEEDIDAIFEKFTQLNRNLNRIAEGTGLGLPIAKSLAELHGGNISVKSIIDKGSTFTIELPIKKIDNEHSKQFHNGNMDRDELIKYEFSDIYL